MQAAALQRQLVLKSYNWPWWSTCRSQLCKGNWQLVLKSYNWPWWSTCRSQLCKGNWCSSHTTGLGGQHADCCGGYIITYIVIILGNMQAAALQRQLVLKSYNWPWWSTCRSQLTVSNSPQIYRCHISVWKGIIYLYI